MIDGVTWEDLSVLLAGLQHGSLGRAARSLGIGQSTASRRLVRLEARLGSAVFERTPDGLTPTALAWELEPHALLIQERMADIARVAQGQEAAPAGLVRLAVVEGLTTHFLLPHLAGFLERFPELRLDLLGGHAVLDLVRHEADLALRFVRPTAPDLVCASLGRVRIRAYQHPTRVDGPVRWIALHDPELRFQETRWLQEQGIDPVLRVTSWHDLHAAVCQGLGAGLFAPQAAEPAGLVPVHGLPDAPSRELYLVYHRALRDVPRIAAVRTWLLEVTASVFERHPG